MDPSLLNLLMDLSTGFGSSLPRTVLAALRIEGGLGVTSGVSGREEAAVEATDSEPGDFGLGFGSSFLLKNYDC